MSKDQREELREQIRQRQRDALQKVLVEASGKPSPEIVQDLKAHLGVSRATAYRIVKTLRTCGAVSAATRPVGRPKGSRMLDARREQIIRNMIVAYLDRATRGPFSELVQEIGRRCESELLPTPNWRTIRARYREFLDRNP